MLTNIWPTSRSKTRTRSQSKVSGLSLPLKTCRHKKKENAEKQQICNEKWYSCSVKELDFENWVLNFEQKRPELTFACITQYASGLKDWILSCRSTQNPSVGVWQGPNEIKEESKFPYFPWKYLVWKLKIMIVCDEQLTIIHNNKCLANALQFKCL